MSNTTVYEDEEDNYKHELQKSNIIKFLENDYHHEESDDKDDIEWIHIELNEQRKPIRIKKDNFLNKYKDPAYKYLSRTKKFNTSEIHKGHVSTPE